MEGPTTELATSSQPATETAAPAAPESTPEAPRSSEGREPGAPETAAEVDDLAPVIERLKSATPEQKKRILREGYDPDEAFSLDDRLTGKAGKLAQQQAERLREAERRQEALLADINRRVKVATDGDPDEAVAILREDVQRLNGDAQRQQQARHAKLQAVEALFLSGYLPEDVQKSLAGKTYSADPDETAKAFYADIVSGIEKHAEARLRKELEPILRKEYQAELAREEPSPDTGHGGGGARQETWRTLTEARAAIRRMTPQEYARRQDEIDAAVQRLASGRGRAA